MKKLLSIISIILVGVGLSHAQVGIGTDNPKGALDLNPDTGYAKWGLVLPVVPSADTVRYGTGANDFYPSVTTPTSTFRTITADSINLLVPEKEAPAGTIVYDAGKNGIRVKRSSGVADAPNGDWCENRLVDETTQISIIKNYIYGGEDFKMEDVSAGYYYTIGIKAEDGGVYAVGNNTYYRTGLGTYGGNTQTWTTIIAGTSANRAKQVSAGYQHSAAVMANGDVYVWGNNGYGRTGRGTTSSYTTRPTKVTIPNLPADDKVIQVEADFYNTMLLTQKGSVYVTGYAGYGLLANANGGVTNRNISTFTQITNFPLHTYTAAQGKPNETIAQLSMAARAAAVVTSEGRVFTWGRNLNGTTGQGTTSGTTLVPSEVTFPGLIVHPTPTTTDTLKIAKVVMGIGSGLAMTTDGKHLYHWGRSMSLVGYTGSTITVNSQPIPAIQSTPVRIDSLTNQSTNAAGITLGVLRSEGEKILDIASPRHRNGEYLGDGHLIITNYSVYASGFNTSYGTSPGKLGIVDPNTGSALTYIIGFQEIADHAIYENTQFTKASIGYSHAFIMTGKIKGDTDAEEHAYQYYTTYGSGNNNYYQQGGGSTSGWRVFSSVKR